MYCENPACRRPLGEDRRRHARHCPGDVCRSAARRARREAEVARLREELAEAREALAHLLGVPRRG